jgi:ATP-dependent helicase HrpA
MRRRLGDADHLALSLVGTGPDALLDDVATATVARFIDEDGLAFTQAAFEAVCARMRTEGAQIAVDIVDSALHIVHVAADVHRRLDGLRAPAAATTVADASSHLSRLVGPGFVARAGSRRLGDVHRYVRGVDYRLDQLGGRLERDRSRIAEVTPLEQRYADLRARARTDDSITVDLDEAGWLLEELRMSLFAQPVGVNAHVSTARIRRLLG